MTEADWLTSDDVQAMLSFVTLDQTGTGWRHVSARKLRLFVCACCRRMRELMNDARNGEAVAAAERFANGSGPAIDMQTGTWFSQRLYEGVVRAESDRILRLVRLLGGCVLGPADESALPVSSADGGPEAPVLNTAQAALFREIIGNPFQPVTLGCSRGSKDCPAHRPDWLTPTVLSLAQAAYDERPGRKCTKCGGAKGYWPGNVRLGDMSDANWQRCEDCHGTGCVGDGTLDSVRLAVLADALEEAGCTEETILGHLREDRPHVRGCFALDLILGKS